MNLKNSKIIVVKIGSSLLVDEKRRIRKKWLNSFAKDIKKLESKNKLENYLWDLKKYKIRN